MDFGCESNHPVSRPMPCPLKGECLGINCLFLHPDTRPPLCYQRNKCTRFACSSLHTKRRRLKCELGEMCCKMKCEKLHPDEDCPNPIPCADQSNGCCYYRHPNLCRYGIKCRNEYCEKLHPVGWDPVNSFPGTNLKSQDTRNEERRTTRILPIYKCYDEFLARLREHKVLIVTAATGRPVETNS